MKNFRKTPQTMSEGSLLVRRMSEKAQKYFYNNEGVGVWADHRSDNEGIFAAFDYNAQPVEYTFDELEREFELMYDELAELEAEDEEDE